MNTHTKEFERKENQDKWLRFRVVNKWFWKDYKRYAIYMQTRLLAGMKKQQAFLLAYEASDEEIVLMWEKR
jgi:hypothetical protein